MEEHRYSFSVPHTWQDMGLAPHEFRLLCHYQRVGHTGETIRELATHCRMSLGQTSKCRRSLAERGLIKIDAPSPGHIYLMASDDGYYKIGISDNPAARRAQLATASPHAIRIIHSVTSTNARKTERELHHAYADKRCAGEWFRLTAEDVTHIIASLDAERGR